MKEDKVIPNDSPEAARFVTGISGWVSRLGHFYGTDERLARYDGCTHMRCDCGELAERGYTKCQKCRDADGAERYNNFQRKEWDRKAPICLYDDDRYFFDEDDFLCYCDEEGVEPSSLRLVLCEPIYAHEIDYDEHYCDSLGEDSSISDIDAELAGMFDKLNEYIRNKKIILSWTPSNIAVTI